MKKHPFYESPYIDLLSLESEAVLCTSLSFGESGNAGFNIFNEDNIINGGDF